MALLILLLPLFVYIAVRICLDSPGGIFHLQQRIGKSRTPFTMYKFRSMFRQESADTTRLTVVGDGRITRWGRMLRKYKLDELPQLWNVVRGRMRWFGPRPEQEYYVNELISRQPSYRTLYAGRPGIISLGVVEYGYASCTEEMARRARYDKYYLQHRCRGLHCYMLRRTVAIILRGEGQ